MSIFVVQKFSFLQTVIVHLRTPWNSTMEELKEKTIKTDKEIRFDGTYL